MEFLIVHGYCNVSCNITAELDIDNNTLENITAQKKLNNM